MVEFIPAILEQDFSEIKKKLDLLEGRVAWTQIDIADGDFAPNLTWSDPTQLERLRGQLRLEIHLMTRSPELQIENWLAVVDRLIFHHEVVAKPEALLAVFGNSLVEKELALLLSTPLEALDAYVDQIDGVQLMGIAEIGRQGQSFEAEVITRVSNIRQKYPDLRISVDGGVNLENASALVEAGANALVVGSAFWRLVETEGVEGAIHSWLGVVGA